MMVIADIDDVFVPLSEGFLVSPDAARYVSSKGHLQF
jgi:hypothetical protein